MFEAEIAPVSVTFEPEPAFTIAVLRSAALVPLYSASAAKATEGTSATAIAITTSKAISLLLDFIF